MSQAQYPLDTDRYQLVWAEACPFAQRAKIARDLLGLENVIAVSTTNAINNDWWNFEQYDDELDPTLQVSKVLDLYEQTWPDFDGVASVPVLYDKVEERIALNESDQIVREFATHWREFHAEGAPELYPNSLAEAIDEANNHWVRQLYIGQNAVKDAQNQADYDHACDLLFNTFNLLDQHFETHEYYHGESLTETDIFIYVILVRFDAVYAHLYAANRYRINQYPHLWRYLKQLHQIPAFGDNTHFDAIKANAYLGKHGRSLKVRPIIPEGPNLSIWN